MTITLFIDGENTETDQAFWTTPEAALTGFEKGRTFLLPPTWTQLDSLSGRTVAEVLAVERKIVTIEPNLPTGENNWEIEFFNSDRYNAAREGRSPDGADLLLIALNAAWFDTISLIQAQVPICGT